MNLVSPEFRLLLKDVYSCNTCPASYGFTLSPSARNYKFPPLIGGGSHLEILFVGINPRRTESNRQLHSILMSSKKAFADLSSNKANGIPYIGRNGQEFHYRFHVRLVEKIFGESKPFESVAGVTELFLCASRKSTGLPLPSSRCADQFLPRTLQIAQPKVIVAVGEKVMAYFKSKTHRQIGLAEIEVHLWEKSYPVFGMPHPANPNISEADKQALVDQTIQRVREHLND